MSAPTAPGFAYRFEPPADPADPSAPLLVLLHGTGGDENDLVALGRRLLPAAPLLSPRGRVSERGMPRFFRRLAEGVFDHDDLVRRTHELADFIEAASADHGVARRRRLALGFSNGANIAASMLLLRPGTLNGAALLRPMVPFEPETAPALGGVDVLIAAGRADPLVPPGDPERLAGILSGFGADVAMAWTDAGHGLVPDDLRAAGAWLAARSSG